MSGILVLSVITITSLIPSVLPAPAPPGYVFPNEIQTSSFYRVKETDRNFPKYDKETLEKEKCGNTPFEWPDIEIKEPKRTGNEVNIIVWFRSWLKLKFVWQEREETESDDMLLYSTGVTIKDYSSEYRVTNYQVGSDYETVLTVLNPNRYDEIRQKINLLVYIQHPCHEVALNIINFHHSNPIRLPEIHKIPKNNYNLNPGSDLDMEIILRDTNARGARILNWPKLYQTRNKDVILSQLQNDRQLRFSNVNYRRTHTMRSRERFSNVGYGDDGLYGFLYIPESSTQQYRLLVYSQIHIYNTNPVASMYTCSSLDNHRPMRYTSILLNENELDCIYCIASDNRRPNQTLILEINGHLMLQKPSEYKTLGGSYYLAQFPVKTDELKRARATCYVKWDSTTLRLRRTILRIRNRRKYYAFLRSRNARVPYLRHRNYAYDPTYHDNYHTYR